MLDHMLSVTNEAWKKEQSQIASASKQRGLISIGMGVVIAWSQSKISHLFTF